MVASRCVRLARCCASCCSSRRSIPASSARLSRSAPMTCCSAIAAFSCDTQDQEHSEQASGHEQLGGGLCYMISEVQVFPEAMRGAGEGHYPWDLEPDSMMTNGTVKGAVTATSGRELLVAYKDSSKTITVPEGAPVVTFAPAERIDLKPGAPVFFSATKNEGVLSTGRLTVGKD